MNVHVNADCISCGLCVSICPDVFHITEGGTAGVYSREVPRSWRMWSSRPPTPAR